MDQLFESEEEKGFVDYLNKLGNEGSIETIQSKCSKKSNRLQTVSEAKPNEQSNWLISKKNHNPNADHLLAKHYYQQLLLETGRSCFYSINSIFPKD